VEQFDFPGLEEQLFHVEQIRFSGRGRAGGKLFHVEQFESVFDDIWGLVSASLAMMRPGVVILGKESWRPGKKTLMLHSG
jgi:hypothetical protein